MKRPVHLLSAALSLAVLSTPAAAQQAERFTLAGSTIKLYNLIGTLEVGPATGGGATAEVTRRGGDGATLTIENAGGTLKVLYSGSEYVYPTSGNGGRQETTLRVRDDGTFHGGDWDNGGGRKVRITSRGGGLDARADIRLLLPAGTRAELNIGVGKVTLANVNGTIAVNTASGDVEGTATSGGLSIDTGSGDVRLTKHDGGLSIDTGSGDIQLSAVKSDRASFDTGSGDVTVDGLTATHLSVDTGSGDVNISEASVGSIAIDTGSGEIRLGLTSDIDDLSVDTGSGDVTLSAPASLGATVQIETSSGDINTEFPLQVTRKGRDGLEGKIGDGQGRLLIDTASGDVTLRRRP
ncbi:MAG TPA: DUF4097 family beta strand repeat-containing protein [Gemmatimonadales bacterium]|nr:DUF4097 family beta strand repeat-containing protein [Gemmatimonadales bacterium]